MAQERFLMIDIGAGTMDILWCDFTKGTYFKAVVESPVIHLAKKLRSFTKDMVITGCEMGGGPITKVLRQHARQMDVMISHSAATTLHHDIDKIKRWNFNVVPDDEAENIRLNGNRLSFTLEDIQMDRIQSIVESFGVDFEFDAVAICAQDHGIPPKGISHLDFRHEFFKERLDQHPFTHGLMYALLEVPSELNRLKSIAESAKAFPAEEIYVMDSGMAAITGAVLDPMAMNQHSILVLDIATSHTVGALLQDSEITGIFEYHTRDITLERLEDLIRRLADGKLDHQKIISEGGHGAYIRKRVGFEHIDIIIVTGPKRYLAAHTQLPVTWGAPLGDNMMTGTVGLLEALRKRKGLSPIPFV